MMDPEQAFDITSPCPILGVLRDGLGAFDAQN
jgi:hypothetical protein